MQFLPSEIIDIILIYLPRHVKHIMNISHRAFARSVKKCKHILNICANINDPQEYFAYKRCLNYGISYHIGTKYNAILAKLLTNSQLQLSTITNHEIFIFATEFLDKLCDAVCHCIVRYRLYNSALRLCRTICNANFEYHLLKYSLKYKRMSKFEGYLTNIINDKKYHFALSDNNVEALDYIYHHAPQPTVIDYCEFIMLSYIAERKTVNSECVDWMRQYLSDYIR